MYLLLELWDRGESFSGKRPFGNSGWESELLNVMESAGVEKKLCEAKVTELIRFAFAPTR